MKIKLFFAAAVVAALGLSSCNGGDAKLAGELAGTWKGETTAMKGDKPDKHGKKDDRHDKGDRKDKDQRHDKGDRKDGQKGDNQGEHKDGRHDKGGRPDVGAMTCTPTLTFVRADGTNGGTLNISADYTLTKGVESVTTATPVNATVSGTVTATGTWTVRDGDEVKVVIDPSKTVVNVDTTSLSVTYAALTDAPQDSLATIKDKVTANLDAVVKPILAGRVQKLHEFDDVKVTGNTLTLKVGHRPLTFTKQ